MHSGMRHLGPRSRRPHRGISKRWPDESIYLITLVVGLLILALSTHAFHSKAAKRSDGLQQLRAGNRAVQQVTHALTEDAETGGAASMHADDDPASASAATEMQQFCEQHFGLEWVKRWGARAQAVCTAAQQLVTDEPTASVTCRFMNDTHMPAASSPHVLCDATNLRLDPSKLRRARCPRRRPGYMCSSPTYHRYERGAWAVNCSWPDFTLQEFSKDHLQDIFESMVFRGAGQGDAASGKANNEPPAAVEEVPTLLVTREIKEHANVFHTFTDLLNVYISLLLMGWQDAPRQVVILDNHPPGPLDVFWPVTAAGGGTAALAAAHQALQEDGGHSWDATVHDAATTSGQVSTGGSSARGGARLLVQRASDLEGPILFRRAVFVPPGYTSLLFAHLYEDSSCPLHTKLFSGFREFVLSSFGLDTLSWQASTAAARLVTDKAGAAQAVEEAGTRAQPGAATADRHPHGVLTVRLITRRPTAPGAHMARQIGNEEEIFEALKAVRQEHGSTDAAQVDVGIVDFAQLAVEQQLAAVQKTDILIGMHGAALAYALLLPPHAALVELWPQASGIWRCYQNFAQWAGVLYRRVANTDPSLHRETPLGDITEMDAGRVARTVRELLPLVRQRRAAQGRNRKKQQMGQEL